MYYPSIDEWGLKDKGLSRPYCGNPAMSRSIINDGHKFRISVLGRVWWFGGGVDGSGDPMVGPCPDQQLVVDHKIWRELKVPIEALMLSGYSERVAV